MGPEQKGQRLDVSGQNSRERWRRALKPFVKKEIIPSENSGLEDAINHIRDGGSLILYSRHRSRIDPLAVLLALYDASEGALKAAPIAYPIGKHQEKLLGINIGDTIASTGVSINPIVTESTLKKWKKKIDKRSLLSKIGPVRTPEAVKTLLKSELPEENTGFAEFSESAEVTLSNGGVVYLPTQSERSPLLPDVRQGERTLGTMAALIRKRKIENVGILFVDVSTAKADKHPEKKGGLDLFRVNKVTFGPFYKLEDALQQAGGHTKGLDVWATREVMARLVPQNHLSPELKAVTQEARSAQIAVTPTSEPTQASPEFRSKLIRDLTTKFPQLGEEEVAGIVDGLLDGARLTSHVPNVAEGMIRRRLSKA